MKTPMNEADKAARLANLFSFVSSKLIGRRIVALEYFFGDLNDHINSDCDRIDILLDDGSIATVRSVTDYEHNEMASCDHGLSFSSTAPRCPPALAPHMTFLNVTLEKVKGEKDDGLHVLVDHALTCVIFGGSKYFCEEWLKFKKNELGVK